MDDLKSLALLFDQLYQKLGRHYASLSRPQRRFLHAIAHAGIEGIGVTALSEHFDVTVAGATRMLDTLESQGLIGRQRQTEDARHVKVFLTELGATRLSEADKVYCARLRDLLASLSLEEMRTLNELLLKIHFSDEKG